MIAAELMTRDPVTVDARTSVAEVWDLMRDLDIRHVPVLDHGVLAGIVSDRDVAQLDPSMVLRLDGAAALRDELARPVSAVMSAEVIAVGADADVTDVISVLLAHRIGAVPVVRPGTRELAGIVSYVDLLQAVDEALAAVE